MKPTSVPNQPHVHEQIKKDKQKESSKEVQEYIRPIASLANRLKFTKEMALRAIEDGVSPLDFLTSIVIDPNLEFTDWTHKKGQLIEVTRTASLAERIDCAKACLPYVNEKKGIQIEHAGAVTILHSVASTVLDEIELDDSGRVIEADDIDFTDIDS